MRFVARKRVGAGSFEGVCNVRCMILLVDIQTFIFCLSCFPRYDQMKREKLTLINLIDCITYTLSDV